jgi:hypothetical protein
MVFEKVEDIIELHLMITIRMVTAWVFNYPSHIF